MANVYQVKQWIKVRSPDTWVRMAQTQDSINDSTLEGTEIEHRARPNLVLLCKFEKNSDRKTKRKIHGTFFSN